MEMQQNNEYQKLGDMEQSFNAGGGLNQINHNLDAAVQKTELPEPGEGEEEEGVNNPEIPSEGDPTPIEQPITL